MSEATLTLANGTKQPMMGSREIAEVTGKDHKNVVRDINTMLEQLEIHRSNLNDDDFKGFIIKRKEYQGRNVIDEIWLDENLSMTLVTGYDAKIRLALIEQWRAMKVELAQPRPASLPAHIQSVPSIQINDGIIQLARVVAEATMKACLDATGYSQPAPLPVQPIEGEYVPVSKAAWATGLSDSTCRKLIGFYKVPVRSNAGLRGLLVNLPSMEKAARKLMNESEPPKGNRKRWSHPQFGNFTYYDLI